MSSNMTALLEQSISSMYNLQELADKSTSGGFVPLDHSLPPHPEEKEPSGNVQSGLDPQIAQLEEQLANLKITKQMEEAKSAGIQPHERLVSTIQKVNTSIWNVAVDPNKVGEHGVEVVIYWLEKASKIANGGKYIVPKKLADDIANRRARRKFLDKLQAENPASDEDEKGEPEPSDAEDLDATAAADEDDLNAPESADNPTEEDRAFVVEDPKDDVNFASITDIEEKKKEHSPSKQKEQDEKDENDECAGIITEKELDDDDVAEEIKTFDIEKLKRMIFVADAQYKSDTMVQAATQSPQISIDTKDDGK